MIHPDGPVPARIMIVGDAPEFGITTPFSGSAGAEFFRMLHEAKILQSECFLTYVNREPAPRGNTTNLFALKKKDRTSNHVALKDKYVSKSVLEGYTYLRKEIDLVKPNIIIALGNLSLWALTGAWGIEKWRGSFLRLDGKQEGPKVIPTYTPSQVLRQWSLRMLVVHDLQKAEENQYSKEYPFIPNWKFTVRPSFEDAHQSLMRLLKRLDQAPTWIEFDLETRPLLFPNGNWSIACAGLSWSLEEAICIPFLCTERKEGYWSLEEETVLVWRLYQILTHKNALVRGQNLLYDSQHTYRHWHFVPRVAQDTMISHHVAFAGLPKKLDFQASLYCKHPLYWKDDGKTWDKNTGEDQLWIYNCVDCVRTREVGEVELNTITALGLEAPHQFQQDLFWPVLQAMQRGVKIDKSQRNTFALTLQEELQKREKYFLDLLGHPLNPRSTPQMMGLFYEDFKLPLQIKRATGRPTLDDTALTKLAQREPLIRPLVKAITEYRSLGVFLSTFVQAPLDEDGRMRCSYNPCGTETYRLSSSENAFGSGTNLQNIPKGIEAVEPEDLELPNVRVLFIPDPGFTFFDMDLDRADLQVVVWESDEPELKAALKLGVDMHLLNAYTLAGKNLPALEELVATHPKYNDWYFPYKKERQLAKNFIHGTNYGGGARTMAQTAGVTVHQADRFQNLYFSKYPGIKRWHERTMEELRTKRYVQNKFGYRRFYFDRIEGILPEALAWVPQSTVACVINRVWKNIYDKLPEVQVLLQVHDSLAGQFPTHLTPWALRRMREEAQIVIPYPDPLIIPIGIKTSTKSWGECK